eukprot:g11835.t2
MAKEMGFDQDFGPQAANMWKMLDDLAVTDRAAYAEMAKAGAEALRKPEGKFFVPVAGFVVKASLARPWAPPPSADAGVGGGTDATKKADRPVDDSKEGRNASGLRIPMFVSRVRETTDHSNERALAVDVVFHPWVMRSCKGEPMFRDQVVALATGWITQEHPGLVVARRRKLLKLCTYKGGSGPKGASPVAFPIEDASLQTDSPGARSHEEGRAPPAASGGDGGGGGSTTSANNGGLLDDPTSLLAAIKRSAADEDRPAAAASPPGAVAAAAVNGRDRKGNPSSAAAAAAVTTPAGEAGQGPAAALGLKPTGGAARGGGGGNDTTSTSKRDIILPGALAGLASAGSSGRGSGRGTEGRRGGDQPDQGRRGPLISEIVPEKKKHPPDAETARGEEGTKAKELAGKVCGDGGSGCGPRASVVKKGFLSSSSSSKAGGGKGGRERAPLYPPGGSENGSEPSAYVKLMSRCKVVDTRDHSKQEVGNATVFRSGSNVDVPAGLAGSKEGFVAN